MIPHSLQRHSNVLSFTPYVILGALIFSFASLSELNYFLKGYAVLLEAQAGIVLLSIAIVKLRRAKKHSR